MSRFSLPVVSDDDPSAIRTVSLSLVTPSVITLACLGAGRTNFHFCPKDMRWVPWRVPGKEVLVAGDRVFLNALFPESGQRVWALFSWQPEGNRWATDFQVVRPRNVAGVDVSCDTEGQPVVEIDLDQAPIRDIYLGWPENCLAGGVTDWLGLSLQPSGDDGGVSIRGRAPLMGATASDLPKSALQLTLCHPETSFCIRAVTATAAQVAEMVAQRGVPDLALRSSNTYHHQSPLVPVAAMAYSPREEHCDG